MSLAFFFYETEALPEQFGEFLYQHFVLEW